MSRVFLEPHGLDLLGQQLSGHRLREHATSERTKYKHAPMSVFNVCHSPWPERVFSLAPLMTLVVVLRRRKHNVEL